MPINGLAIFDISAADACADGQVKRRVASRLAPHRDSPSAATLTSVSIAVLTFKVALNNSKHIGAAPRIFGVEVINP